MRDVSTSSWTAIGSSPRAQRWEPTGAEVELRRSYPPWRPDLESALLATARTTFERLFGAEPSLEIVHGGLECAVIGARPFCG